MEIAKKLTEEKADDLQLDKFEKKLGNTLPSFYREFLKNTNGGRPEPREFGFTGNDGKQDGSVLQYFYALHSGEVGNLEETVDIFRDRIPESTLPIACDPFGNQILLRMGNQPDGPVYFWDHELELEGGETTQISPSLESFIASLK